jgi:aminocarboxymuconate-semialdehyde decarboxylase
MPAETQLSIAAMILGGTFDELPTKLKVMFAHGTTEEEEVARVLS